MDDPGRSEEKLVFMTCSVLVMLKQDADFQGMPQRRGNMRDDDRRRKRRGKGQQSLEKGIRVLRGRAGGRDQGRESGWVGGTGGGRKGGREGGREEGGRKGRRVGVCGGGQNMQQAYKRSSEILDTTRAGGW